MRIQNCNLATTPQKTATAWAADTAYTAGDYVKNDGDKIYIADTSGTSASSGGPTGTGSNITDNTARWDYVGQTGNVGDMSQSSVVTEKFSVAHMVTGAIHAVWTGGGSPTGTFKLQVSNDEAADGTQGGKPGTGTVTTWTDYSGSSYAITTDGDYMWMLANMGFKWVRLVYTRVSGTGGLVVRAHAKGDS